MLEAFGTRQRDLLTLLLKNKAGLTTDELAAGLDITRTAVTQHLAALERGGYVAPVEWQKTGGRPGRVYALTAQGMELFPKQYAWFAGLLLATIRSRLGSEGLGQELRTLAADLAASLAARVQNQDAAERRAATIAMLNELGYDARDAADVGPTEDPRIEASNCVYHELAREYPEVCEFDLELLSKLTGATITHEECMVRGGNVCRFCCAPKASNAS